jgi:hypothetical protein
MPFHQVSKKQVVGFEPTHFTWKVKNLPLIYTHKMLNKN